VGPNDPSSATRADACNVAERKGSRNKTVLGFAAAPWLGATDEQVRFYKKGPGRATKNTTRPERSSTGEDRLTRLVHEPDVGHPTQGNDIVAVGEPPDMPLIASAVAEDGARRSPIQGRDRHVRLINQQVSAGATHHLRTLDNGIVHNP